MDCLHLPLLMQLEQTRTPGYDDPVRVGRHHLRQFARRLLSESKPWGTLPLRFDRVDHQLACSHLY